jgi:serine kinase of HPr protein (carbohydrate metabolism regulator)
VGDDRIALSARAGRLLARPVAPLEGLVERRGLGLTPEPYLPAVVVRLIVDLDEEPARMPEPEDLVARLAGIDLPRLRMTGRAGDERLVLAGLGLFTQDG